MSPERARRGSALWMSGNQRTPCNRFGEALGLILQKVGVDDHPEIYEAHTFVSA